MIYFWIAVGVLVLWMIMVYNGLVRKNLQAQEAWSDIEVQMKRRYDLIPNLMETVKGYMVHERTVFEDVTKARAAAMSAGSPKDKLAADNALSQTLKSLFAVSENYPQLKANENFLSLQAELTDTEDKIQAARRFYNGVVRDYNTAIQTFPTNMMAKQFGFSPKEMFELDDKAAEQPVKVQF